MRIKKTVTIGTVGAGYPAYLHGNGLEKVGGVDVRLKTICDTNLELAQKVMDRYGYEQMTANFDGLLADPEIDVIDIITPPFLHVPMAIKAMRAGKHVICEKPLTGYFGKPGEENVGSSDTVLGGTANTVDVYCNDAAYRLTMTPSKVMDTYFLDEDGIEDEVLGEMLPSKLGWNHAFVSDDVIRGYQGEMQDFMDCIAFDKDPAANFDVAYETARVMYAAYVSAEEGRRVDF